MATDTRFIGVSDFANYEDISAYLDTAYIYPHILTAQTAFTRPVLGVLLYEELQTQVEASTLTAANTTLLEKVKPMLVYKSYQQFLLHDGVYSTNMGLRVYKEENSEPVSEKRRAEISNAAGNMAAMYENELRIFLNDNTSTYPLYDQCESSPVHSPAPRIGRIGGTQRPIDDFYDRKNRLL